MCTRLHVERQELTACMFMAINQSLSLELFTHLERALSYCYGLEEAGKIRYKLATGAINPMPSGFYNVLLPRGEPQYYILSEDIYTPQHPTLLSFSVNYMHLVLLNFLMSKHVNVRREKHLLGIAVGKNWLQGAKLLIEARAKINVKIDCQVPLEIACLANFVEMARLLLANGASVRSEHFVRPLAVSAIRNREDYDDMVELLFEHGADFSSVPANVPLAQLNMKLMRQLLRFGVPINGGTSTMFDRAVSAGEVSSVKMLLREGGRSKMHNVDKAAFARNVLTILSSRRYMSFLKPHFSVDVCNLIREYCLSVQDWQC
jgi:hypothetical protein